MNTHNQRSQPLWTPFLGNKIDIQNSFKRGVVSFESGTVSFKNYAARILKVSWLKFVLDFHRKYYSWKLIQLGLYFGYFGIGIKFWYILIDNKATFKLAWKFEYQAFTLLIGMSTTECLGPLKYIVILSL